MLKDAEKKYKNRYSAKRCRTEVSVTEEEGPELKPIINILYAKNNANGIGISFQHHAWHGVHSTWKYYVLSTAFSQSSIEMDIMLFYASFVHIIYAKLRQVSYGDNEAWSSVDSLLLNVPLSQSLFLSHYFNVLNIRQVIYRIKNIMWKHSFALVAIISKLDDSAAFFRTQCHITELWYWITNHEERKFPFTVSR